MASFRGPKVGPRPDWSPLGVSFKVSDKHPPFHMGVPRGATSDIVLRVTLRRSNVPPREGGGSLPDIGQSLGSSLNVFSTPPKQRSPATFL